MTQSTIGLDPPCPTACMFVEAHESVRMNRHVSLCVCVHVCLCVQACECVRVYRRISLHASTCVRDFACLETREYVHVYRHMRLCVCTST